MTANVKVTGVLPEKGNEMPIYESSKDYGTGVVLILWDGDKPSEEEFLDHARNEYGTEGALAIDYPTEFRGMSNPGTATVTPNAGLELDVPTEKDMKDHTTQEITDKVQAVFDAEHTKHYCMGWESKGCIKVEKNTPEMVRVTVSCMYEVPSPTLDVLMQLAEFFGTKNINDDDNFANCGCETCDYGSSYGYTLTVRPESSNAK